MRFFISYLVLVSSIATAVELRFNAFGNIDLGVEGDAFANEGERAKFVANGLGPFMKNESKGFIAAGTDFVMTADITDNLISQAEVNFQTGRDVSSEISPDVERMYIDYLITPYFNVMAGLYFTPVGFINRNLYARAWLMRGVHVHDAWEEEFNFVPTHTTGVNFHGSVEPVKNHSLMYAVSIGNGRAAQADSSVYARDPFGAKEISLLLEWKMPYAQDFRFGVSGWTDEINSLKIDTIDKNTTVTATEKIRLRDYGFNPFLVLETDSFGILAEYFVTAHKDNLGTLGGGTFTTQAISAEFALKFMDRKLQPYVRYDQMWIPKDGGPYYGLREIDYDANTGKRFYVPQIKLLMLGVAYDLNSANRLKLEYMRSLDGPGRRDRIAVQAAFGF